MNPCSLLRFPLLAASLKVGSSMVLSPEGKCRVVGFFPTEVNPDEEHDAFARWTGQEVKRVSRSMMAVAKLALEHFHNRDATLVKEVASLPPECTVELDLDVISEHLTTKRAGQIMVEQATELCAFLGTYDSDVARAMQPTSAALDLPQVIYYTLDQFLTSSKRPSAVGLPPTVLPHTRGLAEYLNAGQVIPPRQFMQLVYEEAYTSSYFAQCFEEDAAQKFGMTSDKYQDDHLGIIPTMTPEELQRRVMKEVHDSGVKTIFLNKVDSRSLNQTAHILAGLDMLSDEYLYIFQPQAVPTDAVGEIFGGQEIDSPLDRLLRGGLILDHHDPFRAHPETDPFLTIWRSQDESLVQRIIDTWPTFGDFDPLFFQNNVPADYSAFLYDAVMSIGFGACYATTAKQANNDTLPFRNDIRHWSFTGATGSVDYSCKYKSNRCNDPLKFGIFNIQAERLEGTNQNTYKSVITAEWDKDGRWKKLADNIYRDGTTNHPSDLREEWEANYLSKGVRGFGIFLFLTAAGLCTIGLVLLFVLRKDRVILRSQPLFFSILCLGSLLMSFAILTLSFDETSLRGSITDLGLDCACSLSMWFFFCGHVLSFGALVSKTRRLDNVMQFRKGIMMSANQAMLPVLVLMAVTIFILIVWQVLDPFVWQREWIMLNPFETYGSCHSDHFAVFFGLLMALLVISEGLALYFVWKTSDVSDDFSDTKTTIFAMYAQLQAWVVGVPVLAVLGDNADAEYLGRALLIWIFSVSGTASVVGTKLYKAIVQRLHPEEEGHVHVTGVVDPPSSLRSSTAFRLSSSRRSLRSFKAPRKSLVKLTPTETLVSSGVEAQPDSVSSGSSPVSLDSLHSSFGANLACESAHTGSSLFSLHEVLKVEQLCKDDDGAEGSSEIEEETPSTEFEDFNQSGQLSVALFSVDEEGSEELRETSVRAPAF